MSRSDGYRTGKVAKLRERNLRILALLDAGVEVEAVADRFGLRKDAVWRIRSRRAKWERDAEGR